MGVVSRDFFADQPQATRNTMYVNVNWKQRLLATKQENTRCCFRTNSFKAVQPCSTLFYWKIAQKIKIEVSSLFSDLAHNELKARRFDFRPVYVSNRILYLFCWGISYCFLGATAF